MIRIGIIGCGAITENSYLPAFEKSKTAQLTCLVDSDESRVSTLGRGLDLDYAGKDMEAMNDHVDAVIIVVPNYIHHGI
ncbi:MAG: Gfo/Idh/MocA family oxidoreductase, partial [Proteobacteria bacterium]|nr:Gfo/Idh/MocA family oxidoreductase [Pseudomonadota bacterium]